MEINYFEYEPNGINSVKKEHVLCGVSIGQRHPNKTE